MASIGSQLLDLTLDSDDSDDVESDDSLEVMEASDLGAQDHQQRGRDGGCQNVNH